ncbi:trimeric intracellular cation channel family protein [Haloferula chungangensis]|uniref:Trimeric intracellular cation channel family protein n=1 Tax=Haloferula chungangensis TaxID=1048331 RepID=A0ABW2L6M0_9BACT
MTVVTIIEYLAVIAAAIYGMLLASRTGMDFVGSFAVAFLAAFGGGTLRDLFLNRDELFWIVNPHYPITVFVICIIGAFTIDHLPRIKPLLLLPDSLGMAFFTVVGTVIALEAQDSWFIAALMGAITGTFGGVLADVVCNEVPSLFTPAPLCATCSFTGAWVYIIGDYFRMEQVSLMIASAAVVVVFRLLAVRFNWRFPPLRSA